jgi:hypothetical protein
MGYGEPLAPTGAPLGERPGVLPDPARAPSWNDVDAPSGAVAKTKITRPSRQALGVACQIAVPETSGWLYPNLLCSCRGARLADMPCETSWVMVVSLSGALPVTLLAPCCVCFHPLAGVHR